MKVNTTFNAFLVPQVPKVSEELKPLSMVRHLMLEDDMKEYWGFYLLKGSTVTVSTCVRLVHSFYLKTNGLLEIVVLILIKVVFSPKRLLSLFPSNY